MSKALLPVALAGLFAAGCDADQSTLDYDAIVHADLQVLRASPWVKAARGKKSFELGGDLGPDCKGVLESADTVTAGVGNKTLELYIEGAPKSTERCFDGVAKKAGSKKSVRKTWLDGDVFAVAVAETAAPAPSLRRLADLQAADPSPKSDQPLWFTVRDAPGKNPLEYAEGWADPRKGLVAHVSAQFSTEDEAKSIHGRVAMGLAAMSLSSETAFIAKALKVESAGDTFTADVRASDKQMRKLVAQAKAKATTEKDPGDHDGHSGSFKIEIR